MILVLILLDRDVRRSSSIHDSKTMIWLSWGSVLRKPWSVRKFLLHRVCKCIPPLFLIFDSQSIHGELLRHALDEYSCTVDEYIDDGAENSDSHHSGWGFLRNLRKSGLFPGNFQSELLLHLLMLSFSLETVWCEYQHHLHSRFPLFTRLHRPPLDVATHTFHGKVVMVRFLLSTKVANIFSILRTNIFKISSQFPKFSSFPNHPLMV